MINHTFHQGLDALREHFRNSKFPSDTEEYMPVVFSPPRDGLALASPVPIVSWASLPAISKARLDQGFSGHDDGTSEDWNDV